MNFLPLGLQPRVLLVGTDDDTRGLRETTLRDAGYLPDCAADIGEAWTAICRHGYRLLLVGHKLSGGSGLRLILRMSRAHLTLPVIFVIDGALSFEPQTHHHLQSLVVLAGPFHAQQLLATVLATLRPTQPIKPLRTLGLIAANASPSQARPDLQKRVRAPRRSTLLKRQGAAAPTEVLAP